MCLFLFYFIPRFADVVDYSELILPTESSGATMYPPVFRPKGIQTISLIIIIVTLLHHPCNLVFTINHSFGRAMSTIICFSVTVPIASCYRV